MNFSGKRQPSSGESHSGLPGLISQETGSKSSFFTRAALDFPFCPEQNVLDTAACLPLKTQLSFPLGHLQSEHIPQRKLTARCLNCQMAVCVYRTPTPLVRFQLQPRWREKLFFLKHTLGADLQLWTARQGTQWCGETCGKGLVSSLRRLQSEERKANFKRFWWWLSRKLFSSK